MSSNWIAPLRIAELIADAFADDGIDTVHGIPHSGNYLATAVSLALPADARIHNSRNDQYIPAALKDIYREEVRSYTTSDSGYHIYSGITLSFIQKGDRVLFVDDVCATGETGVTIAQGLIKRGVQVVGFAVLFDKVFQGGLSSIQELGIKVFSCIRVVNIGKNDMIRIE